MNEDQIKQIKQFKQSVKNTGHYFDALRSESKILDFEGKPGEKIQESLKDAASLPEPYRTAAIKFLSQAELNLQAGNEKLFRFYFLRAVKNFNSAYVDDLETGRSRKQLGGKTTADHRKREKKIQAAKAAEIYDSLTIEPRYRTDVISKRMQVTPKTVRSYLKETNRR